MCDRSRHPELGAQFAEYVLLLVLIVVLVVAGLELLGSKTADSLNSSASLIATS